jgi:hypothetical protein
MDIKIPRALIEDHMEIGTALERASTESGKVGEAAQALKAVLLPHIQREEEFALPPLGLLPLLSKGEFEYDMNEAVFLADKLKAEMPKMLAEHAVILAAVNRLDEAARLQGKMQYQGLAAMMRLHLEEEEEVYYPAALLVGVYLHVKLAVVLNTSWKP